MNRILLASSLAATMMAGVAVAHHGETPVQVGALSVSHSWTAETSATAHSLAVFTTIANTGDLADRLIAASTGFSDDGVFRAVVLGGDGTVQVVDATAVEIGPGQSLALEPGGIHIMLPDVQQAFVEGDHFHMELTFEHAGTMIVAVDVEHRRSNGGDDHDHAS